jgi:cytochrome c peroxidase
MTLLLALACTQPGWSDRDRTLIASLTSIPDPLPRPANRLADDPAAAALGARLFVDPGFSVTGATSCATCHVPERHFTDGKRVASAVGPGTRNTPSIETAGWSTWFFWDGRADSAWAQVAGPLTNPLEHAVTPELVRARVAQVYPEDWGRLFGGVAADPERVLSEFGKAIEAFERTLGPGPARFDRWAARLAVGEDTDLLSPVEKRGLALFVGEAGCVNCHNGPLLTDHSFHNLGLPEHGDSDGGRAVGAVKVVGDPLNCAGAYSDTKDCPELRYLDTGFPDWASAFKTPSLRNVALTAPYMHDGGFPDLESVLLFYDALPGEPLVGHRELTLKPLHLSGADRAAIIAFLGTLSSEDTPS